MEMQKYLILEGNIVISVGLVGASRDEEVLDGMNKLLLFKFRKSWRFESVINLSLLL